MKTPSGKKGLKKDHFGKGVPARKKYTDPSKQFSDWVSSLDLEKNPLGRFMLLLDKHLYFRQVSVLLVFCLVLSFLVFYEIDLSYTANVGEVALQDVKSPISFEMVDEVATENKRLEEEKAVPLVFDYEPETYETIYSRVSQGFKSLRSLVKKMEWPNSVFAREEKVREFSETHKAEFEKLLGADVSIRDFEWLVENKFSVFTENITLRAISKWSETKTVLSKSKLDLLEVQPSLISAVPVSGDGEEFVIKVEEVKELKKTNAFNFKGIRGVEQLKKRDRKRLLKFTQSLLTPNLTLNLKESTARKKKARESVLPVQIAIKKNQTIVSAGSQVQPIHGTILKEIENLQSGRRSDFIFIATALLLVLATLIFFSYLRRFTHNRVKVTVKDLGVMGVVMLTVVLITKIFLFMTNASFAIQLGGLISASVFLYAAPVAAGPMLVGLLITSGEVVWIYTILQAVVLSFMADSNIAFFITSIVGGIAAARGVFGCKKRNDIYFAGLRTGLVNFVAVALLMVFVGVQEGSLFHHAIWNSLAGFTGGLFSSLVAMMLVPLLESTFNYTTDVKLLELANLNHPLMTQMMMKAPGTYHHCISVGNMVEAAADEIGANALLAKVMALYHDIGKMEHAQYFIENQKKGNNPHDHLSPYMSKTVLISHVKDGAEMGMKYKLGKPIIDGVLQHHGTTLISYFYNRAVEEQDEGSGQVEENDFRYPGPKPQFKEAALIMLADAIEATARSLDEPTPARLQNIVKNIIQSKFIDGQLDECNLTLRDLSTIENAFRRVLLGIYHQRMDYPHMRDGKVINVPQPKGKSGSKGPQIA